MIIPTFNRVEFLKRALSSVLRQTFKDFEVIVVDDASSDETLTFLESIDDFRFKYIVHEENKGVSSSRNSGILEASGDYIALLDSDDEWRKKKLEKQIEFLNNHPESVFIHCNEKWIRNGEHLNQKKIHRKEGGELFNRALDLCFISPSTAVIKRSFLLEIGLFREDFPVCEDYELWLRITAARRIDFLEDVLVVKYGGHEDQLSFRYKAMDFWRVRAMHEAVVSGVLNADQLSSLRKVILSKCNILKAGYVKYQNLEHLEFVETLLQKYGE